MPHFDKTAPTWCPYNIQKPAFEKRELDGKEVLKMFS
jgi:hypothetical protein